MGSESGHQNTKRSREGNTASEQELTEPHMSSQVFQKERTSESVMSGGRVRAQIREIMERTQETNQQHVVTRQQRSSSTRQSEEEERERTSESAISRGRVMTQVREIMQRTQGMRQQSSSPARQSHLQERERTGDRTQTSERADERAQKGRNTKGKK